MGTLYIVATPLGNLEDITLRALRVLKEVNLIAAEDTRRTRKLLSHYQISTPLLSYHSHNQASRGPDLLARLKKGENIALVSDAGTPGFSDPGADLVASAWEAGQEVVAVPGAAAAVAALSMSGFKGDVTFVGFLPRKESKRLEFLKKLADERRVLIFFEAPQRLGRTLTEMAAVFGRRQVLVVRELTKIHQQCWRGELTEVAQNLGAQEIKGECTLVLSCPQEKPVKVVDLAAFLVQLARDSELTGRRLADHTAAELGLPRRQVYQTYLHLKNQGLIP